MRKTTLFFALGLLLLVGCYSFRGTYDFSLTSVERPEDQGDRFGEMTTGEADNGGILYEDSVLKCVWVVGVDRLSFALKNKTENSMKIIWDEAAYIDQNGSTQRIMHSGVKYTDRNSSQPPSVIIRGAQIEDVVIPNDNVYYVSGQYGGWRIRPLFQNFAATQAELNTLTSLYVGKEVRVLLPIEIKGVTNDYIFNFKVDGFSQTSP